MSDELMSCLTCLRVQRESDMLTVENPARGGASMTSFKLCMGCASAIAAALAGSREVTNVGDSLVDGNRQTPVGLGDSVTGADSARGGASDPRRTPEPPPSIYPGDARAESGSEVRTAPGRGRKTSS